MKRVRKQVNDAVTYMKEYGGITNADAEQIGIKNLSAVICRTQCRNSKDTLEPITVQVSE